MTRVFTKSLEENEILYFVSEHGIPGIPRAI
jgi:hypothetical protein